MFLYRIEIELEDQIVVLAVAAEEDEKAFGYVESHLDRHFVKSPAVKQASILEKKRISPGAGYIIETNRL